MYHRVVKYDKGKDMKKSNDYTFEYTLRKSTRAIDYNQWRTLHTSYADVDDAVVLARTGEALQSAFIKL